MTQPVLEQKETDALALNALAADIFAAAAEVRAAYADALAQWNGKAADAARMQFAAFEAETLTAYISDLEQHLKKADVQLPQKAVDVCE